MADDKTKSGSQDPARVAGEQKYEVSYFAKRHGISTEQAQQLIAKHGNDREELDHAASQMGA